ncbi:MAG TPA: hypothetical protein HPP66_09930 [Planctomycetes bacterium]|nr:hypothetical protein [Planctomycetota bacterium]
MPIIFDSKDAVFFVGGRGAQSDNPYAGGGCTKDFWGDLNSPSKTLADVMDANGGCLSSVYASLGDTACDVITNGSGKVRITKSGEGWFTDCCVGLIVRAGFAATYTSGRYEVTAVDGSGDWIDIDETYSADTTCSAEVGGALPNLRIASDNTDANSTTPHNVYILTNNAQTFASTADKIDIDTGGGDLASNTWKRIIGIDNDGVELADGLFVTIDANNKACDCINVDQVDNIEFRHIYAYNTGGSFSGYNFDKTANHYGFILKECKATDSSYAVTVQSNAVRSFFVVGGTYSASVTSLYMKSLFGGSIQGVNAYSTGSYVFYLGYYGVPVKDCIIRSNGSSAGIYASSVNSPTITNCVFYNVTDCISVSNANMALVEYNNIFVVAAKTSGKAINRTAGGIAYSDYSCLWALDGAPNDSDRWGGDGKPEHTIEEDPDLVDAANGNFRPRKPNVLRGGKPDIAGNTTEMGAVLQEYEFARRAKAANLGRMQIIR